MEHDQVFCQVPGSVPEQCCFLCGLITGTETAEMGMRQRESAALPEVQGEFNTTMG